MTPDNKSQDARKQTRDIAEAMLSGKMDLISGARSLCSLRYDIGATDNPVFFPIVGFESDTDDYPIGEQRQLYSQILLQEMDKEIQEYVEESRPSVLEACRDILEMLGP